MTLSLQEMRTKHAVEELRIYLERHGYGWFESYANGHDTKWQLEFDNFLAAGKTSEQFYKESLSLLYHGVYFGEDMWKKPYRRAILEILPPPARIVDFGCGVGSDGLWLAEQGYLVEFADLASRCTKFLHWRRTWRRFAGYKGIGKFVALPAKPTKHDLVFAFDVVEHSPQPKELFQTLEQWGEKVVVDLLLNVPISETTDRPRVHYHHNAEELVGWLEKTGRKIERIEKLDWAWIVVYSVPKLDSNCPHKTAGGNNAKNSWT